MKRFLPLFVMLVVVAAPTAAHAKKLRIAATLPSLAAIAAAVGGDLVSVDALAVPGEDPHYVEARPDFILLLSRADLLLVNGLELEVGWLPALQVAARNSAIQVGGNGYLDASAFVNLLEVPEVRIDRSMGDVHPGGNPHFLLDPRAVASVAAAVQERLAKLDPENSKAYAANARSFRKALLKLARKEAARFASLPEEKRKVVIYHRSMIYLLDWLGLEEVIAVEPKPGIPPNPGHVAKVLEAMKTSKVRAILQEEFYPTSTSKTLVRLAEARLVVIPGGVRFEDGQSYVDYLTEITGGLHAALGK